MLYLYFCRSSFSDFAQKHGRDERFKNVEKMRERESLFNEYLLEVRKKEKEEKTAKREQVFLFYLHYSTCARIVWQCNKYFFRTMHFKTNNYKYF